MPGDLAVVSPTGVYLLDFVCSSIQFNLLLSPYLCFISFLYLDVCVLLVYCTSNGTQFFVFKI